MQDKLDNIDWKALGVPDIPKWFSDLLSDDPQVSLTAQNKLLNRLEPICVIWDGNPDYYKHDLRDDVPLLTVPFLIELLTSQNLANKSRILELLVDMASYTYGSKLFLRRDAIEDEPYRLRARLIREEVRKGIPVYQLFLDTPDSYIDSEEMFAKDNAKFLLRILETENYNDL